MRPRWFPFTPACEAQQREKGNPQSDHEEVLALHAVAMALEKGSLDRTLVNEDDSRCFAFITKCFSGTGANCIAEDRDRIEGADGRRSKRPSSITGRSPPAGGHRGNPSMARRTPIAAGFLLALTAQLTPCAGAEPDPPTNEPWHSDFADRDTHAAFHNDRGLRFYQSGLPPSPESQTILTCSLIAASCGGSGKNTGKRLRISRV